MNDALQTLLDEPLGVAREAARAGARVIGWLADDVPVALILAAGAVPVQLHAGTAQPTPLADRYLESAFSPEARAIADAWLAGRLDFIDSVVFPRTDDSAQRLYYYLCELQRRGLCAGPRALLYDVANIARPTSVTHTRTSTRQLALDLGTQLDALPAALARMAARTALLRDIQARRLADRPLPGSVAWRLAHALDCDWRETTEVAIRGWLAQAPTLARGHRILLAGDPPPDDSLHREIERAGGSVVRESTRALPRELDPARPRDSDAAVPRDLSAADALEALADEHHQRRRPVLEMRADAQWLLKQARDACADAVVCWLIEEDESLPWEIARQKRELDHAGVRTLMLTRQPWRLAARALQEAREFVANLGDSR